MSQPSTAEIPSPPAPGGRLPALAVARSLPPRTAVIDGHLLRRLRHQRGLSLEQLAWQAGVGLTTLSRLERQPQARCRTRTLGSLARQLGADPATIAVLIRYGKNEPPVAPRAAS